MEVDEVGDPGLMGLHLKSMFMGRLFTVSRN